MKVKLSLLDESSELAMGIKVEQEHLTAIGKIKDYHQKEGKFPSNKMIAEWIARDHLKEYKDYYTRLKKAGL